MTYEVNLAGQARADIKIIYDYIANTLMEPVIAKKQYTRIEKLILSLDRMPERYRRYKIEPWQNRNLHVMPVDNYLVFYIVDNKNYVVTVIRILYGARNIDNELNSIF